MRTHWIVRVGDGKNFKSSMKHNIWGISQKSAQPKSFAANVKEGDILWFLGNYKIGKKFLGVATYVLQKKRETGPLISFTPTNEELGWSEGDWEIEIHYKDLYLIEDVAIIGSFAFQFSILKSTSLKTEIDFANEYENILRYSKATQLVRS
jgi:hypothetical protein